MTADGKGAVCAQRDCFATGAWEQNGEHVWGPFSSVGARAMMVAVTATLGVRGVRSAPVPTLAIAHLPVVQFPIVQNRSHPPAASRDAIDRSPDPTEPADHGVGGLRTPAEPRPGGRPAGRSLGGRPAVHGRSGGVARRGGRAVCRGVPGSSADDLPGVQL